MGLSTDFRHVETDAIPRDWGCPSLAEIALRKPNATVGGPFGSDLVSSDYVASGVPVIRGQNMGVPYVAGDFVFVSPKKARDLQANTARPLDVVFTQRGTLGQVSLVPESAYSEYIVSQSQMKVSVDPEKAVPLYVLQYFASPYGQRQILESAIQTGVPHTNLGILRNYRLPLPSSLVEQRDIAEVLANADVLIDSLEQLLTKKRRIKQGAMQNLLSAKRRLPGFGGPWRRRSLRKLAVIQRGASPRPIDDPIWFDSSSSVGWVRISDVSRSGMFLNSTTERLSEAGIRKSRFVGAGSLIMSICATVGRPIITRIDACIHDGFVVFDCLRVDQQFLYYSLLNIEGDWSQYGQTGSQMNLNTGLIGRTLIPIPDEEHEQIAIAQVLCDLDADLAATEARLDKARDLKQAMMQVLLTGRIRLR